jgi:cbb3-type cytochrome oxidase subunit 3
VFGVATMIMFIAGFVYSIYSARERNLSVVKAVLDPPEYSEAFYLGGGIFLFGVVFWDYLPQKFQGIND